MLRGSNPVIFGNVTWNSPFFRDFDEEGIPIHYPTKPGSGNRELDPGFVDPLQGDFTFKDTSPLRGKTIGFNAIGIMRDDRLPQPPVVKCRNSYGRDVLALTPDIIDLIEKIARENDRINSIEASYSINYKNYMDITPDRYSDPDSFSLTPHDKPVVSLDYAVSKWIMNGSERFKRYSEQSTVNGITSEDSGEIVFNGQFLEVNSGRFKSLYDSNPDPLFIGERPFREAQGGFYRDYDQFVKGAMGPAGTFYYGFLRIMGGMIAEMGATVDGHECIVVRYPHIGKDQYFYFYLDPSIGYRPRKMEQYFNGSLYRVADKYRYKAFPDNIHLPVRVNFTDYGVRGKPKGQKVAEWKLVVDESTLKVNQR